MQLKTERKLGWCLFECARRANREKEKGQGQTKEVKRWRGMMRDWREGD